jgi:molybdenum cofactor biosynthesis enzyme MoaA
MQNTVVDHRSLYRLPWSLPDNPIAWLEPTQQCNLSCDGCYRENVKTHRSMEEVRADLQTFADLRNFDGISIAGGDPLMHPQVVEIVREVTRMGRKAIINTNGKALTREMLVELKRAGLVSITFHVDSRQGRPGWRGKTEKETNELRQEYTDLVASVGGVSVAFNSTVYEETLHEVPDVLEWAGRNMGKVHTLVFILFRAAKLEQFDYYAWGKKVEMDKLVYTEMERPERRTDIQAREVVAKIREREPAFEPCAYLNGTEKPDSLKWLTAIRVGTPGKIHGYLGPRFMEAAQSGYHLLSGRYLAYGPRWTLGVGRTVMSTAHFDAGVRRASRSWLKTIARNPTHLLEKQHLQSVLVIQPIDILEDGQANMCDGCPDMTVHEGKLVWSCRLEEQRNYGQWVQAVPKEKASSKVSLPVVEAGRG